MPDYNRIQEVLGQINPHHFFSVRFNKRMTGYVEPRRMTCRRGVRRFLRGGELGYDPLDKNVIIVWSPDSRHLHGDNDEGYRAIPVEAITEIRGAGRTWVFNDAAQHAGIT